MDKNIKYNKLNTTRWISWLLSCLLLGFWNCSNPKENVATKVKTSPCRQVYDSLSKRTIYSQVDTVPMFRGGAGRLSQFIAENYKKPEQDILQGRIVLTFIVEEDGSLTHKAVKGVFEPEITPMEKEGLRVLELMPKWEPGRCNGKPVAFRMILPVFL